MQNVIPKYFVSTTKPLGGDIFFSDFWVCTYVQTVFQGLYIIIPISDCDETFRKVVERHDLLISVYWYEISPTMALESNF